MTAERGATLAGRSDADASYTAGGRGTSSCNVGQFCQWQPAGICGAADAGGLCQYTPDFCPQVFKQVCGCDDKTYSNACVAANAGMSVVSDGACKK